MVYEKKQKNLETIGKYSKMKTMKGHEHHFYWAAFELIGDGKYRILGTSKACIT